jgi:hypothetical protein
MSLFSTKAPKVKKYIKSSNEALSINNKITQQQYAKRKVI